MSQVKHRDRLRQQRNPGTAGGISAFQAQTNIGKIAPVANHTGGANEGPAAVPVSTAIDAAQVKATAAMLAGLDPDQYRAGLEELASKAPAFYDLVVAELNAMNEETEATEGDGFDLSGVKAAATKGGGLPAPAPSPQQIAQELANVDELAYKQRLEQLEETNPTLYSAVVDELTKMNEQ